MKILIFQHRRNDGKRAGREILSDANVSILECLFDRNAITVYSKKSEDVNLTHLISALQGWNDGLDLRSCQAVIEKIANQAIDAVYIDGSNFGHLVQFVKKKRPKCTVVTFFHNVEAKFFWDAFQKKWSIKTLGVMIANFLAERNAVRYSDRIVCLTRRDGLLLKKLYGREATDIFPMYIREVIPQTEINLARPKSGGYALFVGGAFYANLYGIRWFAKNVAPFVNRKTIIVGQGFEQHRKELERFSNIEVVGAVASVEPWYLNADFVIAPIFEGSGMKTKVAEAMMFGKPIAASPEALVGYEDVLPEAVRVCESREQFIEAFSLFDETGWGICPDYAQKSFAMHYSEAAARTRFEELFASLAGTLNPATERKCSREDRA